MRSRVLVRDNNIIVIDTGDNNIVAVNHTLAVLARTWSCF